MAVEYDCVHEELIQNQTRDIERLKTRADYKDKRIDELYIKIEKMENKLRSNGLADMKVDWQDERYSTVEAEEVLLLANLSREERKKVIDKQAAVIILQSYMDRIEHMKEHSTESIETASTYFDD